MAPVPVVGPDGKQTTEMRQVEIDERLLTQVAQATGGQFFRAVDAAALGQVYRQINALEGRTIESTVPAHYAEIFRWPLGAMVVLLLLELGISAVRAPLP
jgi:Ca-activated chloride channel family protein